MFKNPCLILLLLSAKISILTALTCYQCASPELRDQWPVLTSLASMPNAATFHKDCVSNPGNLEKVTVACSSVCVTLVLQTLDAAGNPAGPYYVRGCHDQLTGTVSDGSWLTVDTRCEAGTVARVKSDGKTEVNTNMLVEFCKSGGLACNGKTDGFARLAQCTSGPTDTTCQQCKECQQVLTPGTCKGRWCFSTDAIADSRVSITKGCMPVNVYGHDMCTDVRGVMPDKPGAPVLSYYSKHCSCNKGSTPNCNQSPTSVPDFCNDFVYLSESAVPVSFLCGSNGVCKNRESGAYCECKTGYSGIMCENAPKTNTPTPKPCGASHNIANLCLAALLIFVIKCAP